MLEVTVYPVFEVIMPYFWSRGLGWLVLPIVLLAAFSTVWLSKYLAIERPYNVAMAMGVGGLVNWVVGRRLNAVMARSNVPAWKQHSMYGIPMQWWSLAFFAVALVYALRVAS